MALKQSDTYHPLIQIKFGQFLLEAEEHRLVSIVVVCSFNILKKKKGTIRPFLNQQYKG